MLSPHPFQAPLTSGTDAKSYQAEELNPGLDMPCTPWGIYQIYGHKVMVWKMGESNIEGTAEGVLLLSDSAE